MQPHQQEPVNFGMMVFPGKIASALPLERTRVNAHITGLISTVAVVQSFINPFDAPIELEYLFPLPENAALVDFTIHIGGRIVHADLGELEQIQQAYQQARQEGKQAGKLDQRRPNLFAIQLANVLPAHPIQVSISYEHQLSINPDELEFVFPMGLTPKYHRDDQPDESKDVDSPVAFPGEKVGPVEIEVTASLGRKTGDPTSTSHPLSFERLGDGQFTVNLKGETIPDHDFILRFPIIEQSVEPVVWCTQDENSEFALVNWLPVSNEPSETSIQPREFVFILDRSGSMSGEPIRQARNALRACLRILETKDTFRILLFDDRLEWYKPESIRVAQDAVDQADLFLNSIEGRGGTEIVDALEAALDLPTDRERLRYVLFLTDGAVSAEERALQSIRKKLKQARIFTFGIGPSVNRALLSKMAQLGRGAAEFLQLNEDIEGTILRFQDKVAFPVLTDIQLDWTGCKVWDLIPTMLPDLYAGQSLQLVTRLKRNATGKSSLHATGLRGKEKITMEVALPRSDSDLPEVKRAWARARIDELLEQSASGGALPHKIRQEVIGLAMEHRLVTPYTAFMALDSEVVNPKGEMLSIAVAQPLPEGLARGGFFPQPPPQMAQASFAMPSMPRMIQPKRAMKDAISRETAVDNELYQQGISSATNFKHASGEMLPSPPAIGMPLIHSGSTLVNGLDSKEILRWLARTQNLNGSWSEDVELTSVALLVFVRQGHTTRRGFYRKQVGRAAEWLLQANCDSPLAHIRALALHELATAEPGQAFIQEINTLINQLPPAMTAMEQTIQSLIKHPEFPVSGPQRIIDLDSLRLAAILKQDLEIPAELLKDEPQNLVRVWMAVLAHKR
jgi:Ca-activated chloride channel family protein